MNKILLSFIAGTIFGVFIFRLIIRDVLLSQDKVLGKAEILRQPTITPTNTPTPSPYPTETPTPTPKPSPTPKPTPAPIMAPSDLRGLFARFANEYKVDSQLLLRISYCESKFNTQAVNGDYVGLFQFGSQRWKDYRNLMGQDPNPELRLTAEESIKTASFAISKGKLFLWPNCIP